jgi:2-dehydro-3-deoxy-D-arabinonate dehydratase
MKLCRFENEQSEIRIGLLQGETTINDLTAVGIDRLTPLLERDDLEEHLRDLGARTPATLPVNAVRFLAPIEKQEVWAAGVTYLRSKKARMEESEHSATAYDLVYEADRPELFFKSLPEKVASPNGAVGIRKDAKWNVPEPELALVINSKKKIVGYTIGNDMSSRDIEGANLLYLPQAKVYQHSCALGPFITIGVSEEMARKWQVKLQIARGGVVAFEGETSISQVKRSFPELVEYLFRSQVFPYGAILLTGTGVVPPDHFTLQQGDQVSIQISGVGTLSNPVVQV